MDRRATGRAAPQSASTALLLLLLPSAIAAAVAAGASGPARAGMAALVANAILIGATTRPATDADDGTC